MFGIAVGQSDHPPGGPLVGRGVNTGRCCSQNVGVAKRYVKRCFILQAEKFPIVALIGADVYAAIGCCEKCITMFGEWVEEPSLSPGRYVAPCCAIVGRSE